MHRASGRRWLVLAIAIVGILIGRSVFQVSRQLPIVAVQPSDSSSQRDRAFTRYSARLLSHPAFAARVKGMTQSQANDFITRVGPRATLRLDDSSLVTLGRIIGTLTSHYSRATCENMGRGPATATTQADVRSALAALDSSDLDKYYRISADALLAELNDIPLKKISDTEVKQDVSRFLELTPPGDAARIRAFLADEGAVNGLERCWAISQLFLHSDRLEQPHAAHLVRGFLQG